MIFCHTRSTVQHLTQQYPSPGALRHSNVHLVLYSEFYQISKAFAKVLQKEKVRHRSEMT